MPVREFVDPKGVPWRVWSTYPTTSVRLAASFAGGWLTFESATALRRLAPVPEGWSEAPDAMLVTLCQRAAPVARRQLTGPVAPSLPTLEDGRLPGTSHEADVSAR